jgi:putative ABC transport system permease protein
MFKNYIKTALRNLKRNLGYATINVAGLAVGIAASLLIFLVIRFETGFDNFHKDKDRIYRVTSAFKTQDGIEHSAGIAFPAAPALRAEFPQLRLVTNMLRRSDVQFTVETNGGQTKKFLDDVYYADTSFFELFNFPWLAGDPVKALSVPGNAVLTQEYAEKYFGNWHNAIGQSIKYNNDNSQVYKVAGVIKNIPVNSDFPLGVVVSFPTLATIGIKKQLEDWVSTFGQSYCFVKLAEDYAPAKFNKELIAFSKRHKPAESAGDFYIAQPLSEMHYDEEYGNYREHTFSRSLVRALELIGLFLILVACVNFINLATAQAVNRAKEVGVRKVLGGNKRQLSMQFLCETGVITLLAVIVAISIAYAALPFLNRLLEVQMSMNIFRNTSLIVFLVGVTAGVTLLSGIYPAFVISSFNPISALKTKLAARSRSSFSLRRVLVVIQFAIAHILIIGTMIVISQMNYFNEVSLGFDKTAIINVEVPGDSISKLKYDHLRYQLKSNPGIENLSFSYSSPAANGNWNSNFKYDHGAANTDFSANLKWADVDYFKTYNLRFIAGGPYQESDTVTGMVVNKAMLDKLGVKDPASAIGKEIDMWDGAFVAPIVGVINDFNSYSLREPIAPVLLGANKDFYSVINIKIKRGKEKQVLASVEKLWNQTFPDYVYQYKFLDETIKNFYAQENQLAQLYKIFAGIAILISCLGLYGLVSFMAVQRTKEVGIRKVLGASVTHIVYLLSREFSFLIIIAFAIAAPIAWYIMDNWLQNYAFRIRLGFPIFLLAIVSSVLIAWITVGHRAVKAALANPVKNLRTE